jgi:Ca-activated chloride channel family protein
MQRMRRGASSSWPALRRVSITRSNAVQPAGTRRLPPAYLLIAALVLGIVALARPQWGDHEETSFSQSREVLIALDLSRSMWAEDMPGPSSRLHAAKALIAGLLDGLQRENVGLVLFAGTAFVQVPMGPDYQIVREFLPGLDPNYMPRGGSDYGSMLDAAMEGFGAANDRDRYLIVLSDGESTTQGWEKKVPDLLRHNIHVIGIGLGTEQGSVVADQKGGYFTDKDKARVVSRFTPATLQLLASRTGGSSAAASSLPDAAAIRQLVKDTVESGHAARAGNTDSHVGTDRFQWFLLPAVLLALWSLAREFRRHPRPRQVRLVRSPGETAVATLAGLLLPAGLLFAPHAGAHHDAEAGFQVSEAFDGDPAARLRAITAHLSKFGYDPFDLRLLAETALRYGGNERARGKLPMAGVIHDAVDATRKGRQLAPQLAPWEQYATQLDALLAPFPTVAQEQPKDEPPYEEEEDDDEKVNGSPMSEKEKEDERKARELNMRLRRGKTEFALGDLSGDDNFAPQEAHGHRPRPPPPEKKAVQAAEDEPRLAEARKNIEAVVKADSPARVHQLLKGDAKPDVADQDL